MSFLSTVRASVPTGKALAWIGSALITSFLGGVGWVTMTSDVSAAVEKIPVIEETLIEHATELQRLRARSNAAEQDRKKMLCLLILTATGEQLSPPQVADRCP